MSILAKTESGLEISAAVVAGPCRERVQRVLDGLYAQTAIRSMEIIVVDLVPMSIPRLRVTSGAPVIYLSRPDMKQWGQARVEAAKAARARASK